MRSIRHLLVIRLSAMGDVAMMVPVLKCFTETYPEIRVTLLTRRFFAPLFKDLKNVEVFEAEVDGRHKGVAGLKKLSQELKVLGIDAVADLHNVLRSNILKWFFKIDGIPLKQVNKGRKEKKRLTRNKNKVLRPLKSTHQRYADVFYELGLPLDLSGVLLYTPKKLPEKIRSIAGKDQKRWLGIAPFAKHQSKVYPLDLMEEVLQQLQKWENLKIFFFGGGTEEIRILDQWEEKFWNAINVGGKLTFEEELSLISNLDAMLSMDSGNGHLAANFGVPVVTLWGLTHPFTGFAPFRQPENHWLLPDLVKYPAIPTSVYGKDIPEGYEDAMRSIPPGKVVEKLREITSPRPPEGSHFY